jgi:hypothetical protein
VKPLSRRPAKAAGMPSMSEDQLQAQVWDYLSWALADNAMAFAIPNGGSRNRLEAIKLKRLGTTAGVPDLEILHMGRALFVELKTERGSLSESQKFTIPRIEQAGCPVGVCRSVDEVKAFLAEQHVPVRAESRTTEAIRRGLSAALSTGGVPIEGLAGLPHDDLDAMIDTAAGKPIARSIP